MRWNHTITHGERPFTVGFVSPLQEPAQPRIIATESDRKIRSIDQLGSIWKWESQLNWLVPDLLAEGSVNLLSGASDVGKTWLALFLAGAVAHGMPVFSGTVHPRRVLYLDGENPAYVVKQKLYDLGIPETPNLKVWGGWEPEPAPGPDAQIVIDYTQNEHPLLIWDSLVEFHPGDEQSSRETRDFMRKFRRLANLGATVVLLHHTGKSQASQEYRGSSDIKAAVDMAFLVEKQSKGKALDELTLQPFKTRLALVPTRLLKFVPRKGFVQAAILANAVANEADPLEVVKSIVGERPGQNQSEIVGLAKKAGIAKHKVEEALEREGVFRSEKGTGRTKLYYLVEQEDSERWKGQPV